MPLYTAGHRQGVVAAPHRAAADAGRLMLAEGGNAVEAMVAMAAAIAAAYPHMNHLGGDAFWLCHEPSGRVRAIMGAGPAGARATRELYLEYGYEEIPERGALAALTVPGAVATWMLALEAARAFGAHLPLQAVLAPAIEQAKSYVVTPSQARVTAEKLNDLKTVPGFAQTFLVDDKPPAAGSSLAQQALAATLEQLAHAGLDDFYRGDVGREIAADLDAIASPVTRADLAGYRAAVEEPLSLDTQWGRVFNTPPPTQGLASLIILGLFDRARVGEPESFEHVHTIIEATKLAFRVRDRCITDPARVTEPPENYLKADFLDRAFRRIERRRARPWPGGSHQDTVWLGAADASGLVISFIQSLYWEFGSGCVLPRTGVLMQNRGASFSLDRGALNALEPGRRPFHTLNPALAVLNDGRILGYGTMGGDGQPQTQAQVFTRHAAFRDPMEVAIDRPRWVLGPTWGLPQTNVRLEARLDPKIVDALLVAGHDIEVLAVDYSDIMGHAGAVVLHPSGMLEGAHDPRADGGAEGV
jgi:oxamate amidohydrolase